MAGAFLTQGFVFISLTTRLPAFSDRWSLSEVDLSLLLLALVLLAGVGTLAGRTAGAAARLGRAAAGRAASAPRSTVPAATLAPNGPVFAAAVAGYGVTLGVVDAVINMQAVALEHRYGEADPAVVPRRVDRSAAWSARQSRSPARTSTCAGWPSLAVVPLAALAAPYLPHERAGARRQPTARVPWRPILLVGARSCSSTWSTPRRSPGDRPTSTAPSTRRRDLVALATFPYLLASGFVRLAGDGLVRRHGAVRVLRVGRAGGLLGLAVVVFAPTWPVAVLGFLVSAPGWRSSRR